MILVCDTTPLVAAANSKDTHHRMSVELLESYPGRLVVPSLVVTEVCYLLRHRVSPLAEAKFVASIAAGEIEIADLTAADWLRVSELVEQYLNIRLGVVDAAVIAIAERLGTDTVATINPRDFRIVRPVHVPAFRLLPADGMV